VRRWGGAVTVDGRDKKGATGPHEKEAKGIPLAKRKKERDPAVLIREKDEPP